MGRVNLEAGAEGVGVHVPGCGALAGLGRGLGGIELVQDVEGVSGGSRSLAWVVDRRDRARESDKLLVGAHRWV